MRMAPVAGKPVIESAAGAPLAERIRSGDRAAEVQLVGTDRERDRQLPRRRGLSKAPTSFGLVARTPWM